MKFLITALMFFSVNLYAEAMAPKAEAINSPEDKFATMCSYLEAHILDTHNEIVEIDGRNAAAVEAGVLPSTGMLRASSDQWAHQAQDASIYGNLRCFERSNAPMRMKKRR
jgi:hypothetical protein